MQRYKLVLGGTVAGIAGVLAFPTTKAPLSIPSASASSAASSASSSSGSTTGTSTSGSTSPTASATTTPSSSTSQSTASTTRTATSADETFRYGDIALTVTVKGSAITKVSLAALDETDGRSQQIDSYAIPQLEQQVISAGSASIDGVSGATFTSQAFVDALDNALQKLGIS